MSTSGYLDHDCSETIEFQNSWVKTEGNLVNSSFEPEINNQSNPQQDAPNHIPEGWPQPGDHPPKNDLPEVCPRPNGHPPR